MARGCIFISTMVHGVIEGLPMRVVTSRSRETNEEEKVVLPLVRHVAPLEA